MAPGPAQPGSPTPRPFWLDDDDRPVATLPVAPAQPTADIALSPVSLLAITIAVGWLAGLWLGAAIGSSDALTTVLGLALIASLLAVSILQRRHTALALATLALAAVVAGAMRYQPLLLPPADDDVSHLIGASVTVRGIVDEDPTASGRWADYRVRLDERTDGDSSTPISGLVVARVPSYLDYRIGDRIELRGNVTAPSAGDTFSYRDYLARQGIRASMAFAQTRLVERGNGADPLALLAAVRRTSALALERAVAEPSGTLAAAMILGDRSGLPRDLRDAFNAVGATHIIAISGMNFAMLVAFLLVVLRPVPSRFLTLGVTLLVVAGYAALVGPQPSVVRAAIMGGLFAWGRFLGRPNDTLTGLAVSAVGMTAVRPDWLWDVGFQLSFVATAGLAVLSPPLERLLRAWPTWLRIGVATNLAATVATIPITATSFGQIAPASIPVTLLAVPVLGPSMLSGALTVAAGLIWAPLAAPFGWITWALLRYMVLIVEFFAGLPGSSLQTGTVSAWLLASYYVLLVVAVVRSRALGLQPDSAAIPPGTMPAAQAPARRTIALHAGLALAALALWIAALWPGESSTVVTFLDVGQGDATLIRTAGGRTVLIDGGPDGVIVANALGRRLPFWDRRVDVVLVTHTHEDHIAGLIEVVRRFQVDHVIEPAAVDRSPVTDSWLSILRERGIAVTPSTAGQKIPLDDRTELEVVAAPAPVAGQTPGNDTSVIYRVSTNGLSVLVPGDLPRNAQRQLLALQPDLAASALKVPHHGADDALDDEFLAAIGPRLAVISVGVNNRFGHPTSATLQQLAPVRVFRTDTQGSVEVELAPDGLRVRTQR